MNESMNWTRVASQKLLCAVSNTLGWPDNANLVKKSGKKSPSAECAFDYDR